MLFNLQALKTQNFRNLEYININFSPQINLFIGDNAQGKTNILEAIALACSLRPMQALSNSDLIQSGKPKALISADFCDHEISIEISPQGKKAKISDKNIISAQQRAQSIPLVSFIPQELNMLTGLASLRRRALDQASIALYFEHYRALKAYEKILVHRNRLLKSWPLDYASIASFTKLLIQEGALIIHFRIKTLLALELYFSECVENILGASYKAKILYINYKQNINYYALSDLKAYLDSQAIILSTQEHMRKVTLFGPHLDDIEFIINNQNAKTHASRGQLRSLVLAFKIALIKSISNIRNTNSLVILDDIISELDNTKKNNLIQVINNLNLQSFFSCTSYNNFNFSSSQVFKISNGAILD